MKKRLVSFFISIAASASIADPITGIYSNLHQQGDDLMGQELAIVKGAKGKYYGILQCAQGTPDTPMVILLTIKKETIKFKIPDDNEHLNICPTGKFSGKIEGNEINGEFETQTYKVKLKKGNSYWQ